jgi:hypothetical protein
MKYRDRYLIVAGLTLVSSMLACGLPTAGGPPPVVLPTLTETKVAPATPTGLPTSQPIPTLAPPASPTISPQPVQAPTQIPPTLVPTYTPLPTYTALPTYTTVPTHTPVPTVSYAGPGKRQGISIPAVFMSVKPVINADFSEWNMQKYSVNYVVFGSANWTGSADLSGKLMVGWDNDKLYIAIKVVDDTYVQNAHGAQLFKGDSLDILVDTNVSGDYYLRALNGDDFQLGISPGSPQAGNNMEAYLWYPTARAGSVTNIIMEAYQLDDGYRLEAAIPWSIFGVIPYVGQHFGFAFSLSDDDQLGTTTQQSMTSTLSTRKLTDPTTWGDLTLVK